MTERFATIGLERLIKPCSVDDFLYRGGAAKLQVSHGPLSRFPELQQVPELFDVRLLAAAYDEPVAVWFPERWFLTREHRQSYSQLFQPASALKLWRMGATIIFHHVHHYLPKVRAFIDRLERELGVTTPFRPSDFNVFASGPGAGALPHFDPEHNFAIHLEGHKRWWMTENTALKNPKGTLFLGGEAGEAFLWKTLEKQPRKKWFGKTRVVDMRPGSTMYFPSGYWHRTASPKPSAHLVMAVHPRNWGDVIEAKVRAKLPADLSLSPDARRALATQFDSIAGSLSAEELLEP